jgi:phospholipase A1
MISVWQAYDGANSAPFRETNYNPELFYRVTPSNSRLRNWGFDIGGEHTSNGQTIKHSRSWNRLYFAPHYRWSKSVLYGKVWYRINEDDCVLGGEEVECDNNPDISDFYGHAEVTYDLQFGNRSKPPLLRATVGGNLSTGKGRISVEFSYPAVSKDVYWHLWAFHGYGESLADHDQSRSRVGVGFRFLR